jgi:hypothetical protein
MATDYTSDLDKIRKYFAAHPDVSFSLTFSTLTEAQEFKAALTDYANSQSLILVLDWGTPGSTVVEFTLDDPRINPSAEYGEHINLTCVNHPGLRWSTKNIAPIGCRSIFWWPELDANHTPVHQECTCPASDLIPAR